MFTIITGKEKYKVIDLSNGGESFFDDKLEAYKFMAILVRLGRHYRLEVRDNEPARNSKKLQGR
jgi:hypothetical protein